MASEETENFYRLASLLVDLGTEVLRQLFIKYAITQHCKTVSQFLCNESTAINRLNTKNVIRGDQMKLLYPGPGKVADHEQWDISLLTILLKNLLPITSNEKADIESLRNNRNFVYGHKSSASLSHLEFTKYWTMVERSISALAAACNDQNFIQKIKTNISRIKVGPLNIRSSVDVLIAWYQRDATTTKRLAGIETKLDEAKQGVLGIEKKFTEALPDPIFENLKRNTQILIKDKCRHPFVYTEQYKKAKSMLFANNAVVVAGKPGEGKTMMGLRLMENVCAGKDQSSCVLLYEPSQWDHLDVGQVDVVMLDDVFGKYSIDRDRTEKWRLILFAMQAYVNAGHLKVIITTRSNVLKEAAVLQEELELMQFVLQLSSEEMSEDEKTTMLDQMIIYFKRNTTQIDVKKCCSNYKAPIGFPYSCFLFVANQHLFNFKERFFKRPLQFFIESIEGLDKKSKAALLFLFYKKGRCFENDLKPRRGAAEIDELKCYLSAVVGLNDGELTSTGIRESLHNLTDIYISLLDREFLFAHNTIYECVALMHGVQYPEEVIANCTWDFLQGCITVGKHEDELLLIISKENYIFLSKKFISELLDTGRPAHFYSFRDHTAGDDEEFCTCFYDTLHAGKRLKELLTSEMENGENGFLARLLKSRAAKATGKLFLALAAIPYLTCDATPCTTEGCWKCLTKNDALRGACCVGNAELFAMLLEKGAKLMPRSIVDAVEGGNDQIVQDVITILKEEGNFDGTIVYASKALFFAAKSSASLYDLLKEEGVVAMPLCIYDSCVMKNVGLVKKFTTELKKNGRWDPSDFWIIHGMNESLRNNNIEMYEYLKAENVRPNRGSLPCAVKSNDIALVKHVVSDMKKCGTWATTDSKLSLNKLQSCLLKGIPLPNVVPNITDKGLAEALIAAKCMENKEIYNFLVSERIEFNMQTLQWAVKQESIGFVEEVIDVLETTGRFNLICKEGGDALIAAKLGDKPEIYELLISKGVEFVMENLTSVVVTQNFELVQTMIQSLENAGKWTPAGIYTQIALTEAHQLDNKNIFTYLLERGAQINASSVIAAVVSGELNSVQMCIDAMKSTNTWYPSNPLLVMCLQLSQSAHKDIHEALLQAGVGTSSSTLLQAARANDIMAILTVDELVKSQRWNPISDQNIIEAFSLYFRRFNVTMYNVLVKKGCIVSISCLHTLLTLSRSLMYGSGPIYKKPPKDVPSLVALSASLVAKPCVMDVAKNGYQLSLFACIHAYEECSKNIGSSDEFKEALESACKRCDCMVYNIIADAGTIVTRKCIVIVIDSVLNRLSSNTTSGIKSKTDEHEDIKSANSTMNEKVQTIMHMKPNSLIAMSVSAVVVNFQ